MATTVAEAPASYSAAPQQSVDLSPVAPEERIHALDMLRGWAMFGVLWSNLNDWYGTAPPATVSDRALAFAQAFLLESRFYTLLCVLFGIGFGIQLTRAAARGRDVTATYYRRSASLLAIGLVHGLLIWNGDILTMYALAAFALVLFRDARPRQILVAAALLWFIVPEVVGRARFLAGQQFPVPNTWWGMTWLFETGSWREIAGLRVTVFYDWFARWGLMLYWGVVAMFLAGLWSVKSGFLRRVIEDRATTRRLLYWSLAAAAVGYAANAWFASLWPVPAARPTGITDLHFWSGRQIVFRLFDWATVGGSLAYAAGMLLLWQTPLGSRVLRPLAATGRMPLTMYLTQSVVCTLLFFGYGFGLYTKVGFTGMLGITVALFGVQMVVSTWWLRRFRFGPAEWLWRKLTYGKTIGVRLH
jgi:uncharacterized protein